MIRILHVIDSLDLGGAQTVLVNLARFHDRTKYEVSVAAMHGRGVFADALTAEGVEVISLSSAKFPPAYLWSLPALLLRGRHDILHAHLFGANWIAKPLAALCGVPVRVNHDHCNDRVRNGWRLSLDRAMNRFSSHVIAVSESTRSDLLGRGRMAEESVTCIPNGVDTERFRPPAEVAEREAARRNIGLTSDRLLVAGLGRLHPQKNWPLFLQVAGRFPEADFVVAGTGPEEAALRRNAPRNVRFIGFRDSREVLAAADVFMLTSDYEGMPMTLLEAMACGVPAVVSGVDGCREILGDGEGGVTARSGDAADFAAKLAPFLSDAGLRARQGKVARERVLRDHDARAQTKAVEAVYEKLLSGR
jgi:glycosyltransferase involved in cell wall biosynthesis